MPARKEKSATEVKRVGKFGVVGILNTLIDFTIYDLLWGKAHWAIVPANIVSTTVAMIFSFFANKNMVFKKSKGSLLRQAVVFYAVTAFGLYVLQNGTISLFKDIFPAPLHFCVQIAHAVGLSHIFSDNFMINNGAKAIGTVVSLVWNYIMYKKVVFK